MTKSPVKGFVIRRPLAAVLGNMRSAPDRSIALQSYAQLATRYEGTTARIRSVRSRTIERLDLQPGDTVFDVACGAGAILRELARAVGDAGQVIGIEQSPEMAELARRAANGAANVQIVVEPVEDFRVACQADAVILCYTHDVLQSPPALANLFSQVKPGARVAVAGLCLAPWWGVVGNAWVLWGARQYLTTWRGLQAPWQNLLVHCPDLRVVARHHARTGYIAIGTHRPLGIDAKVLA